jgi:hypothetical protein
MFTLLILLTINFLAQFATSTNAPVPPPQPINQQQLARELTAPFKLLSAIF